MTRGCGWWGHNTLTISLLLLLSLFRHAKTKGYFTLECIRRVLPLVKEIPAVATLVSQDGGALGFVELYLRRYCRRVWVWDVVRGTRGL